MDEPRGERRMSRDAKRRQAAARRRSEDQRRRKKAKRTRQPEPQVHYVPAKPLDRRRLLVRLVATFAVVVALVMGVSIFFKVRSIQVTGNSLYSAERIIEASGIETGANLLSFGKDRAAWRIKDNLEYVNAVQIGIKFPDVVIIYVTEDLVTYSVKDEDGQWWLMNADGKILEQVTADKARESTQILGITACAPQANQPLQVTPQTQQVEGETSVTAQDKLSAVRKILRYLEDNGITGEVTTVDVTQLYAIELWYGEQYQVLFGGPTQLNYKVQFMAQVVEKLADYQTGVIDLTLEEEKTATFTPW